MGAPFLRRIEMLPDRAGGDPFNVRTFANGIDLTLSTAVTFLVGENGSGKSTLLEALAECIIARPSPTDRRAGAAAHLEAQGHRRQVAADEVSNLLAYGGKSLHTQSHGESFMALFTNRFEQGLNAPERFFKHLLAPPEEPGDEG
jgi:predicted ATPase